MGVFTRMMEGLSSACAERTTAMIDTTYLKAHRTASSLAVKRGHEHQTPCHYRCQRPSSELFL
jgi:hypothetical protein